VNGLAKPNTDNGPRNGPEILVTGPALANSAQATAVAGSIIFAASFFTLPIGLALRLPGC
jgi:hypothetical protein